MTQSQIIHDSNYIFFQRNDDHLTFFEFAADEVRKLGSLKIGWSFVLEKFITSDIPGEGEIEAAINYIEDELMKDLSLVNAKGLNLYTSDEELVRLLQGDCDLLEYTREDIEREFTRYALMSMGRSAVVSGIVMDRQRYIALLVVREILNHLNFSSVGLING